MTKYEQVQKYLKDNQKTWLVTGVAGFIGSKLATELLNLGHEVTGVDVLKYDKSSINHLYCKKNFHFYICNFYKHSIISKFL